MFLQQIAARSEVSSTRVQTRDVSKKEFESTFVFAILFPTSLPLPLFLNSALSRTFGLRARIQRDRRRGFHLGKFPIECWFRQQLSFDDAPGAGSDEVNTEATWDPEKHDAHENHHVGHHFLGHSSLFIDGGRHEELLLDQEQD